MARAWRGPLVHPEPGPGPSQRTKVYDRALTRAAEAVGETGPGLFCANYAAKARRTASGSCSITLSRTRAGPSGRRRPCSQL